MQTVHLSRAHVPAGVVVAGELHRWFLLHAAVIAPRSAIASLGGPLLTLWHFPAFADHISWTLYADQVEGQVTRAILREARWSPHRGPLAGVGGLVILTVHDIIPTVDRMTDLLHAYAHLDLPTRPSTRPCVQLDGVEGGVIMAIGARQITHRWNDDLPPEWQQLAGWLDRCRTTFQQQLQTQLDLDVLQ